MHAHDYTPRPARCPEPGLWLTANWHRIGGTEPACTAEGVLVATRSHGNAVRVHLDASAGGARRQVHDLVAALDAVAGEVPDIPGYPQG